MLFLLTDGEPTVSPAAGLDAIEFDDPGAIRAAVRRWNAFDRVVVHTIAMGDETENELMPGLASDNGGRAVREE